MTTDKTPQQIHVYAYSQSHYGQQTRHLTLAPHDGGVVNVHVDHITGEPGPIITSETETELVGTLTLPEGLHAEIRQSKGGDARLYIGGDVTGYSAEDIIAGAVGCAYDGAVYRAEGGGA